MNKKTSWPSRRLQVGVFLLLMVLAALRVFLPPLSPQRRAEKLYTDAWFLMLKDPAAMTRGEYPRAAVQKVDRALRLSPGNSLYEQALVWFTQRKDLPELLRSRRLGWEARALAAGLGYQNAIKEEKLSSAARLERLAALCQADPTNALPHYWQAEMLVKQGQVDAAVAAVEAGNRKDSLRFYQPALSRKLMDAVISPTISMGGDFFPEFAGLRQLARTLTDHADNCLRQRKVDAARRTLESVCRMGATVSKAEPRTLITFLVGKACFAIGWHSLEPLYQDFGPGTALANYRRINAVLDRGQRETRIFIGAQEEFIQRLTRLLCVPFCLQFDAFLSLILVLLALPAWWVAVRARNRKGEAALRFAPWGEGWLARVFAAVYVPSILLLLGFLSLLPAAAFEKSGRMWPALLYGMLLPLSLATGCVLRAIRRNGEAYTGARAGTLRWLFKAPAAVKAWTRQWLAAAFAAQALFLVGGFLLLIIFFQPIYGAHLWQMERLPLGCASREQALVSKVAVELRRAEDSARR